MSDLFALSDKIIDQGLTDIPPIRLNRELSVLLDDIAMVEAFSNSIVFRTGDGLLVVDTGNEQVGAEIVRAIRGWTADRVNSIVYTHGHVDHVGGSGAFFRDAEAGKHPPMQICAHENLPLRLKRYMDTAGYNTAINIRQFGKLFDGNMTVIGEKQFLPADILWPTVTYSDQLCLRVGGIEFHLNFDKGETDDHTWVWIPDYRAIAVGDFMIWNFPNAGNPQKVQRYAVEWSRALKRMAALDADYLLPSHGLPIHGRDRIRMVLLDTAAALDSIINQTLEKMNAGLTLNDILATFEPPTELMRKPYLQPLYDEPEFTVRNLWRLYGGWYDGNPSHLKPASDQAVSLEIAHLAGGALKLAARARELAESDLRVACHLVEAAALAEPKNPEVHEIRAEIYTRLRKEATSIMAKGIFRTAAEMSRGMTSPS